MSKESDRYYGIRGGFQICDRNTGLDLERGEIIALLNALEKVRAVANYLVINSRINKHRFTTRVVDNGDLLDLIAALRLTEGQKPKSESDLLQERLDAADALMSFNATSKYAEGYAELMDSYQSAKTAHEAAVKR